MTEPFKICKIMILYMLDQVDFPLTTSQISDFILTGEYTNYFTLQQCIAELIDSGFIREENAHTRTYYHLTEEGKESLAFFKGDISPEILADIDHYLKDKQYELKNQAAIRGDYYETPGHEYAVRLQVLERETPLIDLTITVPSKEEAQTAVEAWDKHNEEIYTLIMEKLL